MEKSKVYFSDFRVKPGEPGLAYKLRRLMETAGIGNIDMDSKFVAIKMHFGELGNLSFLRPNYARAVADLVKDLGGHPFLTDCNTMYPGSRKNALEAEIAQLAEVHLDGDKLAVHVDFADAGLPNESLQFICEARRIGLHAKIRKIDL